jgi:hypothetical protein
MKKRVPKDHTTPMLVAVLSIFLLTELPQGVMLVLTGVFSQDTFHQKVKNLKNLYFLEFFFPTQNCKPPQRFFLYYRMSQKTVLFGKIFKFFFQKSISRIEIHLMGSF